jgi:23S rRNA A2030 N6-methylase RlmJ
MAAQGIVPLSRLEIDVGRALDGDTERLAAAGLLIANAPYGFDAEMRNIAGILAPRLGHAGHAPASITLVSPSA